MHCIYNKVNKYICQFNYKIILFFTFVCGILLKNNTPKGLILNGTYQRYKKHSDTKENLR